MGDVVQLSLIETEKPSRAKKKKQLSESWTPSEANLAYAASKGLTDRQALQQAELFLNYWLGHGKPMQNWDRVWNTWVLNAVTRYGRGFNGNSSPII